MNMSPLQGAGDGQRPLVHKSDIPARAPAIDRLRNCPPIRENPMVLVAASRAGANDPAELIERGARSVVSLAPALASDEELIRQAIAARQAQRRGYFRPDEDDRLRNHFARYLMARAGLLQTIDELRPVALGRAHVEDEARLRAFVVGYAAACLLVRAGRFLLRHAGSNRAARRKLDEADPARGVPRKQFTRVYRSLTSPINALRLSEAQRFAADHHEAIGALAGDAHFAPIISILASCGEEGRIEAPRLLRERLRYRLYSLRRRHGSALRKASFAIFERSGRIIADVRNPFHRKRVTREIQTALEALLQPGDVIITRHDDAMSNLFLPGFWPHASLHIGPCSTIGALDLNLGPDLRARWRDPIRVLEARKDGVLLRALSDTLAVDSVAVIRPTIDIPGLREGLRRALSHEGKLYDFEFDFSRSDRLVCTELVYRAYDGVGPIRMELRRRAGRLTFSAEDLLNLAIEGNGFEPVAVFGIPGMRDRLVTGREARPVLARSYREVAPA
jgi:hypothetical protein